VSVRLSVSLTSPRSVKTTENIITQPTVIAYVTLVF